jgi:hypothetical protein
MFQAGGDTPVPLCQRQLMRMDKYQIMTASNGISVAMQGFCVTLRNG